MQRARAEEETIEGVAGIRFRTDARPDTALEAKLQEIQSALSGGQVLLPSPTTLPHLELTSVQVVDGESYAVISLWVPRDLRSDAAAQLEAAGFTLE